MSKAQLYQADRIFFACFLGQFVARSDAGYVALACLLSCFPSSLPAAGGRSRLAAAQRAARRGALTTTVWIVAMSIAGAFDAAISTGRSPAMAKLAARPSAAAARNRA